uniref:DNA-directed RNA polymerase subunit alpha n=1 Tax=Climaconeis cf. scalaris TaxID=2846828 RepID=A0A8F8X8J2_9STRA|nr:RNA polymerase alpha subunit [Climaconeis cf. scalaris]QYB19353.1 RNA polymerase alpha subunit [Climaconeis cf. scalaris]
MNLIYLNCLKSKKFHSDVYYSQFLIGPLEPGQGITIGNQLRRVLLGDIGGVAISGVRIIGITHEFSTIPGVREDILEILLNLKGIVIKGKTENIEFGRLKVQGPTIITAASIELPSHLKIINTNHYIATVSTSSILEIEFKFEYGIGYKIATGHFIDETDNYLQLDTVFMPIKKVDFKIESVRDIENIISERLLLEVWTNGSILPSEAIKSAIQFIIDLFTSLIVNKKRKEKNQIKQTSNLTTIKSYSNVVIEELELPVRAYNCLKKAQINTVSDLLQYSPKKLLQLRNFGQKSADDVFLALKNKLGIIFK